MMTSRKLLRRRRLNWKSLQVLTILLTMSSSGCASHPIDNSRPPFPAAEKQVGQELQIACITQDTHVNVCPHLFGWLAKIHKLEKQLSVKQ